MPVPLLGKLVKAFVGTDGLVDAADVEVAAGGGVPAAGTAQGTAESVAKLERLGPSWLFDDGLTSDPPFQSFRFNNADPDLATAIFVDRFSESGRFDELFESFGIGGYLYLQDQTTPADNILFRTTGTIVGAGGDSGWFEIPVTRVRSQFGAQVDTTVGDRWNFLLFPVGAVGSATRTAGSFVFNNRTVDATSPATFATSLSGYTPVQGDAFRITTGGEPFAGETISAEAGDVLLAQAASPSLTTRADWVLIKGNTSLSISLDEGHFLEQVTATNTRIEAADVAEEVGSEDLLFWLRASPVEQSTINDPGVGLRIDEAQEDSFTQAANSFDTILYIGIETNYSNSNAASTLQCVVTNADGSIAQILDLDTDFAEATELTIGQFRYYRTTSAARGTFLGYESGQVVTLRRTTTELRFTLTDAPRVDVTDNVQDLPESRTSGTVQAKLNSDNRITVVDSQLLDTFASLPATPTPGQSIPDTTTIYAKSGELSSTLTDFFTWTASSGLPTDTTTAKSWYVLIPRNLILTAMTGSVSGTGLVTEVTPSNFRDLRAYLVTLPADTDTTNRFIPTVTTVPDLEWTMGEAIKISADNLDTALRDDLNRAHDAGLDPALADFEDHLSVAFTPGANWEAPPNPQSYRSTITRAFAAYWDEQRNGATPFTGNYFNDLADPTITLTNGHNGYFADANDVLNTEFPGKQSFFTGRLDVNGAPLTNDFRKIIAFEHYIRNETFTEDIPLLKAGARRIIGIGPNGLHVRRGNRDGSSITVTFDQRFVLTNDGGTIGYLRGVGANEIQFDVPENNPAGTPITFPLAVTLLPKLIQGGNAGDQATVAYTITDRDVSQAQTSEVVNLDVPDGAGGGTRDETILIDYDGTNHRLTIGTAGISTNTTQDVAQIGFEATYNDSQQINDSSTNTDVAFGRQDEHRGQTVSIVLLIEATNPFETSADKQLMVKAVVDGYQENNIELNYRESAYDFSDLQFGPNSGDQIAISNIQVYDWNDGGQPVNAPTHAELYRMWQNRDRWFGLFRAPAEDYRDYTVNGGMILTDNDDSTVNVIDRIKALDTTVAGLGSVGETVVYQSTGTGTTSGELVNSVALPADYATSQYVHLVQRRASTPVEWRMTMIPTDLLEDTDLGTDIIRVQGDSDVTFTVGTRTLALTASQVEIWRVALIRVA